MTSVSAPLPDGRPGWPCHRPDLPQRPDRGRVGAPARAVPGDRDLPEPRWPGRAEPIDLEIFTVSTVIIRAPSPTDGLVIPAIVSPDLAASAAADGRLDLHVGSGLTMPLRVVGAAERFPTVMAAVAAVRGRADRSVPRRARVRRPGLGRPSEMWVAVPDPDACRAVRAALARDPFRFAEVASAADLVASRSGDPLSQGVIWALVIAAATGLLLSVATLILVAAADLRDDRGDLADLEAQGVAPSALRWLALARTAWLAIGGSVAGILVGVTLTVLATAVLSLTADGVRPIPPLVVSIPLVPILVTVLLVVGVILGMVAWLARRTYARVDPRRNAGPDPSRAALATVARSAPTRRPRVVDAIEATGLIRIHAVAGRACRRAPRPRLPRRERRAGRGRRAVGLRQVHAPAAAGRARPPVGRVVRGPRPTTSRRRRARPSRRTGGTTSASSSSTTGGPSRRTSARPPRSPCRSAARRGERVGRGTGHRAAGAGRARRTVATRTRTSSRVASSSGWPSRSRSRPVRPSSSPTSPPASSTARRPRSSCGSSARPSVPRASRASSSPTTGRGADRRPRRLPRRRPGRWRNAGAATASQPDRATDAQGWLAPPLPDPGRAAVAAAVAPHQAGDVAVLEGAARTLWPGRPRDARSAADERGVPAWRAARHHRPVGQRQDHAAAPLTGLDRPTAGRVDHAGHDLAALDRDALARLRATRIGIVDQVRDLVPFLSASENVALGRRSAGSTAPMTSDRAGRRPRAGRARRTRASAPPTACRPASGCGSPSPGRSSPSPSCWSSTSRPRRSIGPARARSPRCSRSSTASRSRSSRPRTIPRSSRPGPIASTCAAGERRAG